MLKSSLKPKAICFFDQNSLCKILTENVEKDIFGVFHLADSSRILQEFRPELSLKEQMASTNVSNI